jgi:hypothetical protein
LKYPLTNRYALPIPIPFSRRSATTTDGTGQTLIGVGAIFFPQFEHVE